MNSLDQLIASAELSSGRAADASAQAMDMPAELMGVPVLQSQIRILLANQAILLALVTSLAVHLRMTANGQPFPPYLGPPPTGIGVVAMRPPPRLSIVPPPDDGGDPS